MLNDLPFIYTISGMANHGVYGSISYHVCFAEIKEVYHYSDGKIGINYDYFGKEKFLALDKNDAFEFDLWYNKTLKNMEKKDAEKSKAIPKKS